MLENIGIDTYMVLTNNHVYLLACGLDPSMISYYDSRLFNLTYFFDNYTANEVLKPGEVYYYGGDNDSPDLYLHLVGHAKSNGTIYLLKFSSFDDYFYFKEWNYYDESENFYSVGDDIYFNVFVSATGGIAFWNYDDYSKELNLSIMSYYSVVDNEDPTPYVNRYYIDNKVCVPLDPSIVSLNYVGNELVDPHDDKVVVNIISGEAQYLD